MRVRAGATFGEASSEVMADVDLFNDHMSRDPPRETPTTRKEVTKKRPATFHHDDDPPRNQRHKGQQSGTKGGKGVSGRRPDRGWGQSSTSFMARSPLQLEFGPNPEMAKSGRMPLGPARDSTGPGAHRPRYPTLDQCP